MELGDVDELKELMPQSDGLEAYYDACVVVLRATFLRVSEAAKGTRLPDLHSEPSEASIHDESHMVPENPPAGAWYPSSGGRLPPGMVRPPQIPVPWGVGFHLIGVARLGSFVLIAFQWQETGEDIYVHTVDLGPLVEQQYAVGMVATLVEINLLERLGRGWFQQAKLHRIQGLTFVEWRLLGTVASVE
ncbi:MAG: hypothetical protein ABI068_13810 [Ktedonobacterales bacterium]